MATTTLLTALERELAVILTRRLRLFATDQAWSLSGPDEAAQVSRAIAGLYRKGLCEQTTLVVAVPHLEAFVLGSETTESIAVLHAVAWQLERRVRSAPSRRRTIVWATPLAVRMFGGSGGRPRQPLQIEHDLGVAATYFRRRTLFPADARRWLGEDQLRTALQPGLKVPDAVLLNQAGRIERAIEYGGQYSLDRLLAFCRYCRANQWGYEIW